MICAQAPRGLLTWSSGAQSRLANVNAFGDLGQFEAGNKKPFRRNRKGFLF